ncbi:hypothetical protein [Leadbetterella byssophila]|uniref:Uncharacterized protein n=1 Tax=Leadbetterella byssophila (strain DSM 17132 / JCM 16389 / KACC 11308 / NBRC 106382 / 4M15) TaxID=649349 RepID=E4RVC2_LEAB4|nr:hypothetical protein [Leadbetterella byssophila]ADQ16108.1 hypothetical protein Lbys_0326 [Leadbetterella byssophila DSM 17132]
MPCFHRFYDELIPNQNLVEYLFIGTFNPSWNAENENNAEYFYGRETNFFWCICPHAFNRNCLIDKGKPEWLSFCEQNLIGLTDLIKNIENADQENDQHVQLLTNGFQDKNLDLRENGQYIFNIDFNTDDIIKYITSRRNSLKGVFFTRRTDNGIRRIWEQWCQISNHCNELSIYNAVLPTPSLRGGGTLKSTISTWRTEIEKCSQD